jgi:hypothetical protein
MTYEVFNNLITHLNVSWISYTITNMNGALFILKEEILFMASAK